MLKKIVSISLIVSMAITMMPFQASAESASFGASALSLSANTDFDLEISVSDLVAAGQVDFELEYDPSLLTFNSLSAGPLMQPLFGDALFATSTVGPNERLMVTISSLDSISGSGVIATVNFRSNSTGGNGLLIMPTLQIYPSDLSPAFAGAPSAPVAIYIPSVNFASPYQSVVTGTDFTLTVEAHDLHDSGAGVMDVYLYYDPEYVSFKSLVDGDFSTWPNLTATSTVGDLERLQSSISIDEFLLGNGNLFDITFTSLGQSGSSTIAFGDAFYFLADFSTVVAATSTAFEVGVQDSEAPIISIVEPSLISPFDYSSSTSQVEIAGTASDNAAVTRVDYIVDTGDSGTADGTTDWSALIDLLPGANLVTVTAYDAAGNFNSDVIMINFTAQSGSASFQELLNVVGPNDQFDLLIDVAEMASAGTLDFGLTYDPDLLEFISVAASGIALPDLGAMFSTSTDASLERLVFSIVPLGDISGAGNVATVTFRSKTTASSTSIQMADLIIYPADFSPSFSGEIGADSLVKMPAADFGAISISTSSDSSFVLPVNASDVFRSNTVDLVLKYDPDYFFFTGWEDGDFADSGSMFPTIFATSTDAGLESLMMTFSIDNPLVSSGLLANLEFATNHLLGTSTISMESFSLFLDDFSTVEAATDTPLSVGVHDNQAPSVSISGPTADNTYTLVNASPVLTLSGIASDNFALGSVTYSVNTGDSGNAVGLSDWSADVTLVTGANIITVRAIDQSGNFVTDTLTVNYSLPDTTPPVRSAGSPSGFLSSNTTSVNLSLATNEDSVCRYSTTTGTAFADGAIFSSTGSTTHSTTVTGLSSGHSYTYYIRCQDENDNTNTDDYSITFSVATASSGGGGGGGGGTTIDRTAPGQISDFKVVRSATSSLLTWVNPTNTDFSKTIIIRSLSKLSATTTLTLAKASGTTIYEGNLKTYLDTSSVPALSYYYHAYTVDKTGNSGFPIILFSEKMSKEPLAPDADPPLEPEEPIEADEPITTEPLPTDLSSAPATVVEKVTQGEAAKVMLRTIRTELDKSGVDIYDKIVKGRVISSEVHRYQIAYFIHYGTDTTKHLGAGERGGVINSYHSAFGRLPDTEAEWQDAIKIANGRWPTERNTALESKNKQETFKKIYKREADMNNPKDNAAVTILTYGLRPLQRNMASEAASIKHFKGIFGHNPVTASEWDVVRAIAYSGATR
jgi:hypothetical protein